MRLRRLEVRHFGKFENLSVEFGPGMNLLYGANESGKSTLVAAVSAILCGAAAGRPFRPWDGSGPTSVALLLEDEQGELLLRRDLASGQLDWQTLDGQGQALGHRRLADDPAGSRQLHELWAARLGYPSALVPLCLQAVAESAARPGLETPLGRFDGALDGVDGRQLEQTLAADYLALTRHNSWGWSAPQDGVLDTLAGQLEAVEKEWYQAQQAAKELARLQEQIADLTAELDQDRHDYARGESLLSHLRGSDVEGEDEAPGMPLPPAGSLQELERELAKTGLPRELPPELPDLLDEAEALRQQLVVLQREDADLQEQLRRQTLPPWRRLAGGLGAAWGLALLATWLKIPWHTVLLMAVGLASAAAGGFFGYRWRRLQACLRQLQQPRQNIEQQRSELHGKRQELEERLECLGLSTTPIELVRMRKNLHRHRALLAELAALDEGPQEALGATDDPIPETAPASEAGPHEMDLVVAEQQLAEFGAGIRRREGELLTLLQQAETLQSTWATLPAIEERGEILRDEDLRLRRGRDVLATAMDLLRGALTEAQQADGEELAVAIGDRLELLSGGRLTRIRLDREGLLQLADAEENWHLLGRYSRAVQEIAVLATRLALVRLARPAAPPPLMLDESLACFDRNRRSELLRVLEGMAEGQQFIVCSHDEQLKRRAEREGWTVIRLATARRVATGSRPERRQDDGQLSFL
jgi:energy-coupling factor transporter ATP-binding protein EcfA2